MPSVPKKKDSSFGVATTVIKQKSKAVPPKKNIFGNIKKNQPKTEAAKRMDASSKGMHYRKSRVKGNGLSSGTNCLSVTNDRGTSIPSLSRGSTGCEGSRNASSIQNSKRTKQKK